MAPPSSFASSSGNDSLAGGKGRLMRLQRQAADSSSGHDVVAVLRPDVGARRIASDATPACSRAFLGGRRQAADKVDAAVQWRGHHAYADAPSQAGAARSGALAGVSLCRRTAVGARPTQRGACRYRDYVGGARQTAVRRAAKRAARAAALAVAGYVAGVAPAACRSAFAPVRHGWPRHHCVADPSCAVVDGHARATRAVARRVTTPKTAADLDRTRPCPRHLLTSRRTGLTLTPDCH
jgi:hypothetical protein